MKKRYLITLRGDNPIKERQMTLTALQLSSVVNGFADMLLEKELPLTNWHDEAAGVVAFHVETVDVDVLAERRADRKQ